MLGASKLPSFGGREFLIQFDVGQAEVRIHDFPMREAVQLDADDQRFLISRSCRGKVFPREVEFSDVVELACHLEMRIAPQLSYDGQRLGRVGDRLGQFAFAFELRLDTPKPLAFGEPLLLFGRELGRRRFRGRLSACGGHP